MLALRVYRDGLCPLCGGPADECQAPASVDDYRQGRFVVDSVRCMRTFQLRKEMAHAEDYDEPASFVFTTKLRGAGSG